VLGDFFLRNDPPTLSEAFYSRSIIKSDEEVRGRAIVQHIRNGLGFASRFDFSILLEHQVNMSVRLSVHFVCRQANTAPQLLQ